MLALYDNNSVNASGSIQSEESYHYFSLNEIQLATNNFDDELVIGIGGFGKVYKGFIDNGATTVAIKRLKAESNQGAEEFWTEVKMLSKLRHTHLVALIGLCNDCQEMILVYEYMANGTLADQLYKLISRKKSGINIPHLMWEQRLNICIGAARGLDYLHTGNNHSFIHRDVKTTNILLDKKWVAKISDFGLSKGTTSHSITHITTKVKGTFGYLDPDYFLTQRLTKKSDVYAFGVVLFEVLCGRPAVNTELEEEKINLVLWARPFIKKGKFNEIIDPSLSGQISPHCLKYLMEVANNCLHNRPKDRPTMAEVVRRLELALASQLKRRTEGIITKVFQGMDHWWRERKGNEAESPPSKDSCWEPPSKSTITRVCRNFSLAEIRAATNNFNKCLLIGQGLSGNVYQGCMDGGTLVVAIKRFNKESRLVSEQFEAEIEVQSLFRHHHIVSLIGYCNEKRELIVVFDYMINGSLREHIYITDNDPLPWRKRLQICIDVAQGLQHIHKNRIVHGNINLYNILLDENWVAKITSFPWSKTLPTICPSKYFAWETIGASKCFDPDLISFGHLLFEMLCAKKYHIPSFYNIRWETIKIDPYLIGKIAPECLKFFRYIAYNCTFDYFKLPSMYVVVNKLKYALKLQEAWESGIN